MPSKSLSPYCVSMLVNKYIGRELYSKVDKETRFILISEAMRQFQLEMIQKFGTLWNYTKEWLRKNGFESHLDYVHYLAEQKGVETYHQYQTECAKENGFKSRYDRMLKKANSQGFKTLHEVYLVRYKKRGFNSQKEYRDFLCKKYGVKSYSQLTKLNKERKELVSIPPNPKGIGYP